MVRHCVLLHSVDGIELRLLEVREHVDARHLQVAAPHDGGVLHGW